MSKCKARAFGIKSSFFALVALGLFTGLATAQAPGKNAIASAHPNATVAGRSVLDSGGNAFDAAIAVAAALAVVEPYSSGIGGGGFFLLHLAEDGNNVFLDAREKAPKNASSDMYLDADGEFVRKRSLDGALAAAVPGLPAALAYMALNYGNLPLAESLSPAILLARGGFEIGPRYRRMATFRAESFADYPEGASIFLKDGVPPPVGHKIVQEDLAKTLESIGSDHAESFYKGTLASKMVEGVRNRGGIWTMEDLAKYTVKKRDPLISEYHGIKVISAPPPSSGGMVLIQALNILEPYPLRSFSSVDRKHIVIESMRLAYRDRADFLGDPDFVDIPVDRLLKKDYARNLARGLNLRQATPSTTLPEIKLQKEGTDTTHFSVLDAAGNRVAATLSINYPFGALMVPDGTGVLLNNEMDDFSARPLTPNAYGLVGAGANAIEAEKRPLSSMTPTFLENEDGVAILGTPGGSRIISMVLIGALEFAHGNSVLDWVTAKRYHHQYLPDEVQFELGAFDLPMKTGLVKRGHQLKEIGRNYGNMQAILWNKRENFVDAASDPRGEGSAIIW
jgi:gamma-glutamyltranspeptidase/glutathione hydrolase